MVTPRTEASEEDIADVVTQGGFAWWLRMWLRMVVELVVTEAGEEDIADVVTHGGYAVTHGSGYRSRRCGEEKILPPQLSHLYAFRIRSLDILMYCLAVGV
jgi:hypothetical protein